MLCKNLQWQEKLWKIPVRVFLDILFAIKSLFNGYGASFIAVFTAHLAVIKWSFGKTKQKRFRKKPIKKLTGVYPGSIVWGYFIRKKKRFSEIVKKNL
jgi:hypothetical protein